MEDTPKHIKEIQLQIWLSKPQAERLRIAIEDNEAQFAFWKQAKMELNLDAETLPNKVPR